MQIIVRRKNGGRSKDEKNQTSKRETEVGTRMEANQPDPGEEEGKVRRRRQISQILENRKRQSKRRKRQISGDKSARSSRTGNNEKEYNISWLYKLYL